MFLDDLHWADQPSFQLLHKIVRSSPLPATAILTFFRVRFAGAHRRMLRPFCSWADIGTTK